jgi:protease IV
MTQPPTGDETPPPAPGPALSAPPSRPPAAGWYTGPFPPAGFGARESVAQSAVRAAVVSLVVVFVLGAGLLFVTCGAAVVAGGIAAVAAGGGAGTAATGTMPPTTHVEGNKQSANKVLLIPVRGPILGSPEDQGGGGLFSPLTQATYGYEVKKLLTDAARDERIRAVVLDMNTPGGTIYGSDAIATGVREYRERTGRPVVAFVAGISASGGMWSMAPATRILADRGTLTGSIGVIFGPFPYYNEVVATEGGLIGGGVTTRDGIEYTVITAGRGKDIGSPYRRLTDEERSVLQQNVDRSYADFLRTVATARGITEASIRDRIGALIYDEGTARELGLVDAIANRQQAYAEAARLAGIEGDDWQVVKKQRSQDVFAQLFAGAASRLGLTPSAATVSPEAALCGPAHAALVYYGDVTALCRGR